MPRRLRYIEFDGQVYLVKRDGVWTFPSVDERLDFATDEKHSATILGDEVRYERARLSAFPAHWTFKDDVPRMKDVDPVVQAAINASLARCVVGVLVRNPKDEILMVKSNRGFTKGMWNIPGGFIDYGEHPEEAAVREIREETGVPIRLGDLVGVYRERFSSPYFMYGFIYEAAGDGPPKPDPGEIDEAAWMAPARAHELTRNPFARKALEKRYGLTART